MGADGRWVRIQCRLCERSVDGADAEREAESMEREAEHNLPRASAGRGAKYREGARFVLKIVPDMPKEKELFDRRVAAKRASKPKRGWLGRQQYPEGTAGYLYAQARAFLSGLANRRREISAIAPSDFDFGEPRIAAVDSSAAGGSVRVSATIPTRFRKPSRTVLMERMGTAMLAGMAASFACELGMKAILMTRLDEAEKTHDLERLYEALPEDSRERLEADFAGIAGALKDYRHAIGDWRYFAKSAVRETMSALVDTDRVWSLGQAARVIADECALAGLTYGIRVDSEFELTADRGGRSLAQQIRLRVESGEAAIAWDRVLAAGLGQAAPRAGERPSRETSRES